jgi:hypothetical protein
VPARLSPGFLEDKSFDLKFWTPLSFHALRLYRVEPFLTDAGVYDFRGFESAVAACGIERPPTDAEYFDKLFITYLFS